MKTETQIIEIMNAHRRTIYRLNKKFISIPRGIDNDIADSILSEIHELQCELAVYRDVLEDDGKKYTPDTCLISNWISVKDILPFMEEDLNHKDFLTVVKGAGVRIRTFSRLRTLQNGKIWGGHFICNGTATKKVTHWMQLPELPENENE